MATRARIGIELKNKVLSSYHHWDGYPAGLGYILFKHYSDRNKLREAIKLGDASVWGKDIHPNSDQEHTFSNPQPDVNVYYGRDRGEKADNCKPIEFVDHEDFQHNFACAGEEYAYLLRLDGTWSIFDYNADRTDGVDAIERIIRERVKKEAGDKLRSFIGRHVSDEAIKEVRERISKRIAM